MLARLQRMQRTRKQDMDQNLMYKGKKNGLCIN